MFIDETMLDKAQFRLMIERRIADFRAAAPNPAAYEQQDKNRLHWEAIMNKIKSESEAPSTSHLYPVL